MDPLEALFVFCFVFGLALSGLSFLLGSLHLGGGDAHASGHGIGSADAHAEVQVARGAGAAHPELGDAGAAHDGAAVRGGPSPFNVNTVTAFLAFFGGAGYLLHSTFGVGVALTLVLSALAGLAGGALVFFFLVKVLLAGQRYLDPANFRMEGSIARVTRPIRADGIGEILFTKDGTRRSEGARSATGQAITVGTEVVILRYERGLAYVEPWESYVEGT